MDSQQKIEAQKTLKEMQIIMATNNRQLPDADFKHFRNAIVKDTGFKISNKFDREKFEQLRAMTNKGRA
jgi:hypothetical protein